jgi:undecaprenyl phosphate N,N'-diacetylbacillosamine 1-phosphate transferase
MYQKIFKPVFDSTLAIILLVLCLPLMASIALALLMAGKSRIFLVQKRPGLNSRIFKLIKFKTMTDERDLYGNLLEDEYRLTPIGRWLRKWSLDELPQLINVLKGELSFVGPRPLLVEYLSLYNETQRRRHLVKPGITGLAQINGRNQLEWHKRFVYDLEYVESISFSLDLKILFITLKKVLQHEGISAAGHATAEKFSGNNTNTHYH